MDRLTPEQRKKNMQAVKNKDSLIEIMFKKRTLVMRIKVQKELHQNNGKARYSIHR